MIDSGPMACVAIAHALIRPVNRVSYCVGGNRISGGTRAMFVLEPDGDNRELKAPHVPLCIILLYSETVFPGDFAVIAKQNGSGLVESGSKQFMLEIFF